NSVIVDIPLEEAVAPPRGVDAQLMGVITALRPAALKFSSLSTESSG
ncbi:MAG: hypothetical protein JF584_08845, partial [Acidobacteria bacterium]|nr:hypothetical protein [Acidobacteriota bacterium]